MVAEGPEKLMLIHLITICVGLIIAFGLQQIVELFQRRRRIRRAQNAAKAPSPGDKRKEL
jgi:hypothetical protein